MALIFSNSCCAICHQQLGSTPIFATWDVFLPEDDPLVSFCDAPMHWSCYAAWPDRGRFARANFAFWIEAETENPYWATLFVDDEVLVTVGRAVSEVAVRFAATGSDIRVKHTQWESWLEGRAMDNAELHPLEREAIRAVLPRLKLEIPSITKAAELFDWTEKDLLIESRAHKPQMRSYAEHNVKCREVQRRIQKDGLSCPHCGRHSRDFRYLNFDEDRESYFICRNCARSFGPDDEKP